MPQIGSFSSAVRLVEASASRAVPDVSPFRHIFTKHKFPMISQFFDVSGINLGPGQVKFKEPGTIKSSTTQHMLPKVYGFGTMATSFEITTGYSALTADNAANVVLTSSTTGLRKYALLINRTTKAVVQVQSVSGATISIKGAGGGAAADGLDASAAGQMLDFAGYAYPDGATLVQGNVHEPTEYSNVIQFHVTETDLGMLAAKRALFPDSTNSNETDKLINFIQHNEGRERAMLFGQYVYKTLGSELITGMKGLDGWSDVEYDVGGQLTLDELRQAVSPTIFQGGGGMRKGVCGNTVLSILDGLMDSKVMFDMPKTEYDIQCRGVTVPMGKLKFMGSEPMNERDGEAWFYDPDLLERKHFEGLDGTVINDLAPNNVLKTTSGIFTAETLLTENPEHITKITGLLA